MLSPEQGPSDDLIFQCAECSARYLSWCAEVGQWRCTYHPGVIAMVDAVGRSWRQWTCCGLMPEVAEAYGRWAVANGVSVSHATTGCTRRDHAAAYEDVTKPVYFLQRPADIASGRITEEKGAALTALYTDLLPFTDEWWNTCASDKEKKVWQTERDERKTGDKKLLKIQSWMPRQASMYDSVVEELAVQAPPPPHGPGQAFALELLNRSRREWIRRVAFGLPPTGVYSEEVRARAASLKGPVTAPANLPLYAVARRGPSPTPSEASARARHCLGLLLLDNPSL